METNKKYPKTKIGLLLCKIGLCWWKYHNYRTCRRCGRHQALYEYWNGSLSWEDHRLGSVRKKYNH